MNRKPIARLIYAIPPEHLQQENGTSQRLQTLRRTLADRFAVKETNLLDPPLRRRERMAMLAVGLVGLSNNLRYLALAHRVPAQVEGQLTLLMGNYCACIALLTPNKPLMLDLVDSLTLTDLRGIQSCWRWRPLLYLAQLPSSWLLEKLLRHHTNLQTILITTYREKAWLERLHGPWPNLHVVPNQVQQRISGKQKALVHTDDRLELAFIGSLNWWVNQVSAQRAVRILEGFLSGPGADKTVALNLYGTANSEAQLIPKTNCTRLEVFVHGYVENLDCLIEHNHAAFLPNPIGRGFQNKLLSCVALGLPTIADASMSPHSGKVPSRGPVIYCQEQQEYENALMKLWELSWLDRIKITQESLDYLEKHFSSKMIKNNIESAINANYLGGWYSDR